MPIVLWNDSYNLGIEVIDEQHRMLIDLINQLHDALKVGKAKNIAAATLASMENYASFHFSTEETLMEKFEYAGYGQHREEHEKFKEKVTEFRKSFEKGDLAVSINIMGFLMDWVLKHILVVDKNLASAVKQRGL